MKIIRLFTVCLLVCSTGIFISCKKEGCKDETARTYDEDAKENDQGMCKYERKIVFGASRNTAEYMMYFNEKVITVNINGARFGSFNIYNGNQGGWVYYSSSEITCGLNSFVLTKTYDLGFESTDKVLIQYLDEEGYEIPGTQNSTFITGSQTECSVLSL